MGLRSIISLSAFLLSFSVANSQSCDKFNLQLQKEIESVCAKQVMTMVHDNIGRNYLYVANKEAGLTIYNLQPKDPRLSSQIPVDSLDGLEVMGVTQTDSFLYLALGNFFSTKQPPGLAMIDVSDPENPFVKGKWIYSKSTEGSSLAIREGDFVYLTAFSHGLMVLDVSQPASIKLAGQFVPELNFPDSKPDSSKINARGMVVENDTVYLCYDAGGIRVIDAKDKKNIKEIGRYSNPVMTGKPRAYNNVAKHGNLLYTGVDYCGVEILDVSDLSDIREVAWWNPWDCQTSPLNWFSSNGHVNEVRLDTVNKKLFLSTGKSDLIVLDVSDPENPDSCTSYGGVSNKIGTWGTAIHENYVYLSYICTVVPFSSNWTGVKVLTYNRPSSAKKSTLPLPKIYPNPIIGNGVIHLNHKYQKIALTDASGKMVTEIYHSDIFSVNDIEAGVYFLNVFNENFSGAYKIMVLD